MAFSKLNSKSNYLTINRLADKNKLKFMFSRNQYKKIRFFITISIGGHLANRASIKEGDRLSFSYDENNNRIWFLKKTNNLKGYKVRRSWNFLMIQFEWKLFEPDQREWDTHYVEAEIYEGGIKINASLPK